MTTLSNAGHAGPAATRVIALEEAFLHPKLRQLYPQSYVQRLDMTKGQLADLGPARLRRMDAAGIDMQVLSHVQPGVQNFEPDAAGPLAREVNDWLGRICEAHPTRFAGFATLPTQSPAAAADELERTVTQLGFKGALINGHTQGRYLDDSRFAPLLERAQALNVPIYIHPTDPPQLIIDAYYQGSAALMQTWGWQVETGTHLLRLMTDGVFDRYPRLRVIVGHMGELLPFALDRLSRGVTLGSWVYALQSHDAGESPQPGMQRTIRHYMRQNVFITTSGVFEQAALTCAIAQVGIDNILFSVDDPFGSNFEAVAFLNKAQLSAQDREKLAHGNAERLLNLGSGTGFPQAHGQSLRRRLSTAASALTAQAKANVARAALSFLLK